MAAPVDGTCLSYASIVYDPAVAGDLNIECFSLGEWQTNCYLLHRAGGKPCWLVDAGFDPQPMIEAVRRNNLEPQRLVLTHAHVDHIGGIAAVRAVWPDLPIAIHEAEVSFLSRPDQNLSLFLESPVIAPEADDVLHHGDELELDGLVFEVRHTPGHSPGGITLVQADSHAALVGDALFHDSVGRVDFPTSDGPTLLKSIQEQLLSLPDETRVLAGHGPETTIGRERANNPFLNGPWPG